MRIKRGIREDFFSNRNGRSLLWIKMLMVRPLTYCISSSPFGHSFTSVSVPQQLVSFREQEVPVQVILLPSLQVTVHSAAKTLTGVAIKIPVTTTNNKHAATAKLFKKSFNIRSPFFILKALLQFLIRFGTSLGLRP